MTDICKDAIINRIAGEFDLTVGETKALITDVAEYIERKNRILGGKYNDKN